MPISIPTSIAGISVPGAINGPLQLLYGNKYEFSSFRYPRNLGTDPTRSHVIRFKTLEPDPNHTPAPVSIIIGAFKSAAGDAVTNAESLAAGKGITGISDQTQKNVSEAVNSIAAADVKRRTHSTISLYIPDSVNVSYSAGYDDVSLTESLGRPYFLAQAGTSMVDLFKNNFEMTPEFSNKVANDPFLRAELASRLGQSTGMNNLPDLALRAVGQAFNPQLQVLFRGVGFRSFQFDFVFTPYSKDETDTVKKIIDAFKFAAAPNIKATPLFSQSLFLEVPYPFEIDFLYKGQVNPYVHKIGRSVLEGISVDYGPNGWATFNDGSPVQIKLTLQFKETVIVDKNRIKEGY